MALRRGARNAEQSGICAACKDCRHTECDQEIATYRRREQLALRADGFCMKDEDVSVPFCHCYSRTNIHE